MKNHEALAREFFENVLYDEEPLFVSDEAKVWDVSMSSPEELASRCARYYGVSVSMEHFNRPLWQLLHFLNANRAVADTRI